MENIEKFLYDNKIPIELKKTLIEKNFERENLIRIEKINESKYNREYQLESKKFYHNTPFIVACVGVLTIAANAIVSYFLSYQTANNKFTEIDMQFAYKTIETELSKTNDKLERANALLFLTKIGVLNSLKTDELIKIAEIDINKSIDNSTIPSIPVTIGSSRYPNYNINFPKLNEKISSNSKKILEISIQELNLNVEEERDFRIIEKYWSVLNCQDCATNKNLPWSAAFISWILKTVGLSPPVAIDKSNLKIWQSARLGGWTYLPAEKEVQPGDLMFVLRSGIQGNPDMDKVRNSSDQYYPTHAGVVYSIENGKISMISGNVRNTVGMSNYEARDKKIIGFARF